MNSRRVLSLLFLCFSILLLQACGSADESPGQNSGGGNTIPGGGPGGDGNESGLPVINLRVEGTEGIASGNSVTGYLMDLLLPAKANALPNQQLLAAKEIRIVRVDSNGARLPEDAIKSTDYTLKQNPNGTYTFSFAASYTSRIDMVIEAELPNGVIMRRPLPNSTSSSKVLPINVATEYAMRAFFREIDQAEFQSLLPCPANVTCNNQAEMKLVSWLAVFEGANDFEIDIPSDASLEEAIGFLGRQVSFTRFINKSLASLQTSKIGGASNGIIPSALEAVVGTYNAVSFGLSLGQANPQAEDASAAILSNWTTSEAFFKGNATSLDTYLYPYVTVSNLGISLISTLLTGDLPMLRNSLTQSDISNFDATLSTAEDERNFLGLTGAFTSLTTTGFYDYGTIQTQSTTGRGSNQFTGWLTNPYFTSLYDAQSTSSMLDARVTDGRVYQLDPTDTSAPYTRQAIKEDTRTFSFLAYSKQATGQSENNEFFFNSDINNRQFGVVRLTQKFSDADINAGQPPMSLEGAINHWRTENQAQVQENTTGNSITAMTGRYVLSRGYNSEDSYRQLPPVGATRTYDRLASVLYKSGVGNYQAYNGRLYVSGAGSERWTGMSNPQGSFISLAINSATDGQGILHAVQLDANDQATLNNQTYRLVGNGFGIDDSGRNFLFHLDNSYLTFDNIRATLRMNQVRAYQDVNTQEVSPLTELAFDATPAIDTSETADATKFSFNAGGAKNAVRMVFADPAAGGANELILEGFATAQAPNAAQNDRFMVLLMRYGNSIGMIYAMKEKRP